MPRILVLSLLLTATLWPQLAQADNGNGNGQEKHDQDSGDTDGGNGQGNGQGNNGQGNGNGQGNNGNGQGNGNGGNGQGNKAASSELSDADTLAVVQSGSAVALETLLADLRARTGGELIDARLIRINGFLVYEIKALSPQGQVSTEYYYARSGLHVER